MRSGTTLQSIKMDRGKSNIELQTEVHNKTSSYAENKPRLIKIEKIINDLNREYEFKDVLDIGCGDGAFLLRLKKKFGFNCYGFDVINRLVHLAVGSGIKAITQDAEKKFDYGDDSFDLIMANEIIEHLLDTDFFLSEVSRILKRGGVFIITTPNLCSFTNRMRILFGKYPAHGPQYKANKGHVTTYCFPVLENQLKEYGLSIIKRTTSSIPFPMDSTIKVPNFTKKIAMWLGDFFPTSGSHIIIVARKGARRVSNVNRNNAVDGFNEDYYMREMSSILN